MRLRAVGSPLGKRTGMRSGSRVETQQPSLPGNFYSPMKFLMKVWQYAAFCYAIW